MSTYVYFACIDHSPPIRSEAESGQHNEVEAMREQLDRRDNWIDVAEDDRVEIVDRYAANGARFFRQHPACRLACVDEYGLWTDLGMGLPSNIVANPSNLGMWTPA